VRILALEPYAALSHLQFLEGYREHSKHDVEILSLPARSWKWRMRTASLHFAEALASRDWDVLFASDYTNLAELVALLPAQVAARPAVLYFHENQVTYPLQPGERRDIHYALTHLHALLVAREAWFNSDYHRRTFLEALPRVMESEQDLDWSRVLERAERRSIVSPLGVDTPAHPPRGACEIPTVVWNHRWEYDKNPDGLLATAKALVSSGVDFRLRVLGQEFRKVPAAMSELAETLGSKLERHGFAERATYLELLRTSDIVLSTAFHEFFGLGTLEAIRSGCLPVLPDDLAYPELLPAPLRGDRRFLYARGDEAETLAAALEAVRSGAWMADREALVRGTDRFLWSDVAPAMDERFEGIVGVDT